MNKEFVKTWVGALRSGEYQQTQGSFSDIDPETKAVSYCCLGLGSHLINDDGAPYSCSDLTSAIPELNGMRLEDGTPTVHGGYPQHSLWAHLVAMNDGVGKYEGEPRTFSQIADFIEETLLKEEAVAE